MTKDRINQLIEQKGLKLAIDRMYSYDTDSYKWVAYIEYLNSKRNYWGVLHSLGTFAEERSAVSSAAHWLIINKYL